MPNTPPAIAGSAPSTNSKPPMTAKEPTIHPTWNQLITPPQSEGAEPAYVELHAEVRDELWKIMWEVEDLAKQHFSFAIPANKVDERFSKMCTEYMTPELQLIVDCVAVGGPNAEEGWKELFVDPELRQALVCGIVGNVIVEQVFKTLVFGANDVQKKVVHEIHEKTKNEDSEQYLTSISVTPHTAKHPTNGPTQASTAPAPTQTQSNNSSQPPHSRPSSPPTSKPSPSDSTLSCSPS